jgi:hypothetical protein
MTISMASLGSAVTARCPGLPALSAASGDTPEMRAACPALICERLSQPRAICAYNTGDASVVSLLPNTIHLEGGESHANFRNGRSPLCFY